VKKLPYSDIGITAEGCIRDYDVLKLSKNPALVRRTMTVNTAWGQRQKVMAKLIRYIPQPAQRINGKRVPQPPQPREVWADTTTGTLYDAETGQSASPLLTLDLTS
jgi:hypothetical protein